MICAETHTLIDGYIDKELDLVTTLQFERHVNECAECRGLVEQYRRANGSVRAKIAYFEAPRDLHATIRKNLHLAIEDSGAPAARKPFPAWRASALAASVAGVLILGGLAYTTIHRTPSADIVAEEVVSSHIRSLMANHLSDVASSDQHTVKPWFTGKLDFAPVVKDLAAQGFPLIGGRLDYLDNHPVAALIYKRRQHTINLFIWPSEQRDSDPQSITMKGFNVLHWTRGHMTYWTVSDVNARDLEEFGRAQTE